MTLYPNQVFSSGDDWTPEIAYLACSPPVYDDQTQYLNHAPRLVDDQLSSATGTIRNRLDIISHSFRPYFGSGLTLNVDSGVLILPDGEAIIRSASSITLPQSATSWVYYDREGLLTSSRVYPGVISYRIAKVVTTNSSIASITDLRGAGHRHVTALPKAIRVLGGTSDEDLTVTANQVLNRGLYVVRNFTVPVGVTCSVLNGAKIIASGNVSIAGTINVIPADYAVQAMAFSVQTGGSTNQWIAGNPAPFTEGNSVPYGFRSYGMAGGGGQALVWAFPETNHLLWQGRPGNGGGSLLIQAAGTVSITGFIYARGTNAAQSCHTTAAVGYSPGTHLVNNNSYVLQACGGGSGGLIDIQSLTSITISPTAGLHANGGNGANSHTRFVGTQSGCIWLGGGCGGGGGYIVMSSPNINTTGATLNVEGGTTGTPGGFGFTTSGNDYTLSVPLTGTGIVNGGSYGGVSASYSYINNSLIRLNNATAGQIIVQNIIPAY